MGRIAKVLQTVFGVKRGANVTYVKNDPGGKNTKRDDQYLPPGDDSQPLPDDYSFAGETEKQGGFVVIAYLDPKMNQKSAPGEKRLYARDSSGNQVCEFWLKNDGSVVTSNDNGEVALFPDGKFEAINAAGSLSLSADGSIAGVNGAGGSFVLDGATGFFTVNTVIIDLAGNITTAGTVTAGNFVAPLGTIGALVATSLATTTLSIGGVDLPVDHTHAYTWTNLGGSGDTDPPN